MRAIYFDTKAMPRILATLGLKRVWPGAVYAPTSPVSFGEVGPASLPGPGGVRVRNRLCGICASDLHLLFVDVDPLVSPAALPGFERIYLGHEVVSTVDEVGAAVTDLAAGQRVLMKSRFLGQTCDSQEIAPRCRFCVRGDYSLCENRSAGRGVAGVGGGWGDGYTCHASELWPVPDGIDDEQATLIEPLACSVRAVLRRLPEPGETALVLGCGMIGLGVVMALRALAPEARVLAVARYPHQQALAAKYGAEVIADRDLFGAVAAATGAHVYTGEFKNRTMLGGVDIIYDCVGKAQTINDSLRLCRAGGTVVIIGVDLHRMKVDLSPVWHQEVDLIGAIAHGSETWQGRTLSTYDLTAEMIRDGQLQTAGLITHRFKLDDWKEAVQTAVDKSTGAIRVAFDYET